MKEAAKTITKENFAVFKKLIVELLQKTLDFSINSNQFVDEKVLKAKGKTFSYVPESKAQEIADKIIDTVSDAKIGSRRLQFLINAALNDNHAINARVYTLDIIAQYVSGVIGPNSGVSYWREYLSQHTEQSVNPSTETPAIETGSPHKEITISESKSPLEETFAPVVLIPQEHKINTNRSLFLRAGLRGGAFAGLISAILIAVFRYLTGDNLTPLSTGYENMSFSTFLTKVFPILLPLQIICGCFVGLLCGLLVFKKTSFAQAIFFTCIFFFVIVVLRQLMARDALYRPGTYITKNADGSFRFGGGYLGEPDFETIATGVMGTLSIFSVIKSLRKKSSRVFSNIETIVIVLKAVIIGIIGWCFIFLVYHLLLRFGVIAYNQVLFSKAFFVVDFPHPERPIMYCSLGLIYGLCLLLSFRLHFKNPRLIHL